MKKAVIVILLLIYILSFNACTKESHEEQPYPFSQESTIQGQQNQLEELKQENTLLKSENQQLKEQLENYQPSILTEAVDLTTWSESEIIQGLAKHDSRYSTATWFEYEYDLDTKKYYDLEGPIFDPDPFYDLVHIKRNRQLTVDNLRIFDLGYDDSTKVNSRYQEYRDKVLRATRLDSELTCYEKNLCRNMKFIQCIKGTSNYYSWLAPRFLFVTRDDQGQAVQTFKKIYCEEQNLGITPLTGSVAKSVEEKASNIFDFIKNI